MSALKRAPEEHLRHYHNGLFPLKGLYCLRENRLSEARDLGPLAMGKMSWVTPRDQKWQDFSQIDTEADQHQAQEIASYLSKVLGEVSLQPKLQGKVFYRGSVRGIVQPVDQSKTLLAEWSDWCKRTKWCGKWAKCHETWMKSNDFQERKTQYNSNILSHVHTRKIACVARVKCARCGVLFTPNVAHKGIDDWWYSHF